MGTFLVYAADESITETGSPLSADIDAAMERVATVGGRWLAPARITRSFDNTLPFPVSLAAPRAIVTHVARPIELPEARADRSPEVVEGAKRVVADSVEAQLRALGTGAFTGEAVVLPYDPAIMGPLTFWTSGEARRASTRDNPPPLVGGVDDNPVGPNSAIARQNPILMWATIGVAAALALVGVGVTVWLLVRADRSAGTRAIEARSSR